LKEATAMKIQARWRRRVDELTPNPAPRAWPLRPIEPPQRISGGWMFVYRRSADSRPEAIIVRDDDGRAHVLLGAMRAAFDSMSLGLPYSSELFLGSTDQGRYQMFDNGVVVWEAAADVGFPVKLSRKREDIEGRKIAGLVAFFDIRGFTTWSEKHTGPEVQEMVGVLEREIQGAFGRAWLNKLFLKGVGDGVMVVSENGWLQVDSRRSKLQRSHRAQFMLACCRAVEGVRINLRKGLALGCAMDSGRMNQVNVLGRYDYLGAPVNAASKLQALAWNEVCLSPRFYKGIVAEGLKVPSAVPMALRAIRVSSAEVVNQWGKVKSSRD